MYRDILSWTVMGALVVSLQGCVAAAPVVLVGAAGGGATSVAGSSATVPQQMTDLKIKGQISSMLTVMKISNANVEVTVFNGIVLLLGQIPTEADKLSLATQIAKLPDVVIVYNQLTVGPNIAFSTYADDSWITSKVKANLLSEVDPLHFVVVTQNGVVYLLGQVTQKEGDAAAKLASQTSGVARVVKIFNYIAPPSTAVPAATPPSIENKTTSVVTPPNDTAGIPQYAPNYTTPDTQIGPAASD